MANMVFDWWVLMVSVHYLDASQLRSTQAVTNTICCRLGCLKFVEYLSIVGFQQDDQWWNASLSSDSAFDRDVFMRQVGDSICCPSDNACTVHGTADVISVPLEDAY